MRACPSVNGSSVNGGCENGDSFAIDRLCERECHSAHALEAIYQTTLPPIPHDRTTQIYHTSPPSTLHYPHIPHHLTTQTIHHTLPKCPYTRTTPPYHPYHTTTPPPRQLRSAHAELSWLSPPTAKYRCVCVCGCGCVRVGGVV